MKNRIVRLETGKTARFTQRGLDPLRGFVRVKGKTISGYNFNGNFYADINGKNEALVTPEGLLTSW